MKSVACPCAVLLLVALAGCSSQQNGVAPTPILPAQSPVNGSVAIGQPISIAIGQSVTGTFIGMPLTYVVTAPSDGRLTIRLSWNPDNDGARLKLTLGDTSLAASPPEWSPVVGVVPVAVGNTYRITIDEGKAPWDYGFNDPFTLTTSLEPSGGAFDY